MRPSRPPVASGMGAALIARATISTRRPVRTRAFYEQNKPAGSGNGLLNRLAADGSWGSRPLFCARVLQWACSYFPPRLLAGKFSKTVPGQGWRSLFLQHRRRYFICCIASLLYSPAGMGGTPQSNGAPRVRDPDAVPMAMTSALICPRTPGPDCWPATPCAPLRDVSHAGIFAHAGDRRG